MRIDLYQLSRRYLRREALPGWALFALAVGGWIRMVIGAIQDINFLVNDVPWAWADDIFDSFIFTGWFSLLTAIAGLAWLAYVGGRPIASEPEAEMAVDAVSLNESPATRLTAARRSPPSVRRTAEEAPTARKLVEYGARHTISQSSVELVYGIHELNSVTVKCTVTDPNGHYYSQTSGIAIALTYYPVRFRYPDDFHDAPALSKGTYRVIWTKGRWERIQRGFSLSSVLSLQEERYEENYLASDSFTIERSTSRRANSQRPRAS